MTKYHWLSLTLLSLALGLFGCRKEKVEVRHLAQSIDSMYTIRTDSADVLVSDSGVVKYRLLSPLWLIYDKPDDKRWVFPVGLRLEGFDTLHSPEVFVVADSAIHFVDRDEWVLVGDVRVHGSGGRRLYTPQLHWLRGERRLFSNDTTYFYTEGRELRGDRFSARDDLSNYSIYRSRGNFEYDEDGASSSGTSPASAAPTALRDSAVM